MAEQEIGQPNRGIRLWGWTLTRQAKGGESLPASDRAGGQQNPQRIQQTPVTPSLEDGAINVQMGAHFGIYVDLDGSYRSEVDLLSRYRTMSMQPEMENAIDDVINEAIVFDEDGQVIKIDLDQLKQPDSIKTKIREEFHNVLRLLDFNNFGADIFRRWYVDGRLYYNLVIDKENPRDGIQQVIYMDPRRVRKIRNITKEKDASGTEIVTRVDVFYLYNEKIVNNNVQSPQIIGNFAGGVKLTEDSVVMTTSGLFDPAKSTVLSYLHKCLTGNQRIKTESGWKYVNDIVPGDVVYTYSLDNKEFTKTKVVNCWQTGEKSTVTIHSRHSSIQCTPDHLILVHDIKTNNLQYIEAQNIIPKEHQVVLYQDSKKDFKDISFPLRNLVYFVSNPQTWIDAEIKHKKKMLYKIADEIALKRSRVYNFVYGQQSLEKFLADKIISLLPIKLELNEKYEGCYRNDISLPFTVDEDFAQLFGFLIGDGWVNSNALGFAEGIYDELNEKYSQLMIKYFGNCNRVVGKTRKSNYHSRITSSVLGCDLLKRMGFVNGAKNKRIPSWVFETKPSIQMAFINGLHDADGCTSETRNEEWFSSRFNQVGKLLVEDIKELWSNLGYSSGKIGRIKPVENYSICGIKCKNNGAWSLYISKKPLEQFENVVSIDTNLTPEPVFDIEVENKNHNFVVNNLVVHNCIRPMNQLRFVEDATVIYRICLAGDTRVKTTKGYKYIKDLTNQDVVYSFNTNGIFEVPVKSVWSNGQKTTFTVKSKHHSITGNETHPVLVLDNKTSIVGYVDIKDIKPKQHSFVWETIHNTESIKILKIHNDAVKLMNPQVWSKKDISQKESFIAAIADNLGLKRSSVRNFLYGLQYQEIVSAKRILEIAGIFKESELDIKTEGHCSNEVNLPEYVDEEFARLFGFLLGDGCVSDNTIVFAEGEHETFNELYSTLLEKYFGNCKRYPTTRKYSNYTTNSTLGADIFRAMGWISGAHNKRIPEWVFTAPDEIKRQFVLGLIDADGSEKKNPYDTDLWSAEIELCNQRLIEDIKELWTSLGYASGHIRHRAREGHLIEGRMLPTTESWSLYISSQKLPRFEKVMSVEEVGEQEVFDIEVDGDKHNFIANGIVVHNSRAPERRAWYIDVSNMPNKKAEQYMKDIMNSFRNKVTYDAATGEVTDVTRHYSMIEDYWLPRKSTGNATEIVTLPAGCLAMDTKVPLLDGRELSITEISNELNEGKKLWSYSCDPKTGDIVPGLISWAGVTQKSAKVLKLTLDNSESIICTPDHKFPTLDKGFIEAKDLIINQSMIPLYKRNKITNIEWLKDSIEVGTLTIDSEEKYHNHHTFALGAGIFTLNSNLGQLDDVLYFEKKLYRALGVPISRLEPTQGFSLGKSNEITRDELKFDKFVNRLRARFSILFDELMGRQLALKGICTLEEWQEFKEDIRYDFIKDNNFAELKDQELWKERMSLLGIVQPFVGIYFSKRWVQENVLLFNEADIDEMKEEIEEEEDEIAKDVAKLNPPPMAADQAGPVGPNDKQLPTSDPNEVNDRFKNQFRDGNS